MAAGRLGEASGLDSRLDGLLQPALVKMMPPQCIRARIFGESIRWKDILPAPLAAGIRILAVECEGEIDRAITALKIRGVPALDELQLELKWRGQPLRQHRHTIFLTFAIAHCQLITVEIQVFHTQPDTLHQPQAAAIEQLGHQTIRLSELAKNSLDLRFGQHSWQALGHLGQHDITWGIERNVEHLAVEKQDRAACLVLGRGRHVTSNGEVGEKRLNL